MGTTKRQARKHLRVTRWRVIERNRRMLSRSGLEDRQMVHKSALRTKEPPHPAKLH